MLNNISTKRKLMLLPIAFIGIVIVSSLIFTYFNNAAEQRTNAAVQTDLFIQQVLKGRISVYQFLRSPDEQKAQKVRDDFNTLNNSVLELKAKLTSKENIELADSIINLSKNYVKSFDEFSQKRITDHKNGIEKESPEILTTIKKIIAIIAIAIKALFIVLTASFFISIAFSFICCSCFSRSKPISTICFIIAKISGDSFSIPFL